MKKEKSKAYKKLRKDLTEVKNMWFTYKELNKNLKENGTTLNNIVIKKFYWVSEKKIESLQNKVDTFKNKLWR